MSEQPHSNTSLSNGARDNNNNNPSNSTARDPQGNATFVDDVLDLVSSLSRSQMNGESTNTNGAEAPQAASAEDSDPPQSIANPTSQVYNNTPAIIRGPFIMQYYDGAVEKNSSSEGAVENSNDQANEPADTSSNQAEDSIQNSGSTPPTYVGRVMGTVTATADLHQMGYGRFADSLNKNDSIPSDATLGRPTPEEARAMGLNQLSHSTEPPNVSDT